MAQYQCQSWKTRYSLLYATSFLLKGINIGSIGPIIPIKAKISNQPQTNYSIVFTFVGIGAILGCLLVNQLAKKVNSHKLISLALCTISFISFLEATQTNVLYYSLFSFLIGLASSAIGILTQVEIMKIHTQSVSTWIQSLHFGYGIGSALSPIIISYIGSHALYVYGSFSLILGLLLLREPQPNFKLNIIQQNPQNKKQKVILQNKNDNIVSSLSKLIGLFIFLYVGAEGNFSSWISTYASVEKVVNEQNAGLSASVLWMSITFGRFIAIPISTKIKAEKHLKFLIILSLIVSSLCLTLIFFDFKYIVVFVGSGLLGLSFSAMYPLAMSTPSSFGYKLSASNTALIASCSSGATMIVPLIGGYSIKFLGSYTLFVMVFLFLIALSFVFIKMLKYNPQQKSNNQFQQITFTSLQTTQTQ